jgi:hypothetical protein
MPTLVRVLKRCAFWRRVAHRGALATAAKQNPPVRDSYVRGYGAVA